MDARLNGRPYAMGEAFTVPDIILGHIGRWARHISYSIQSRRLNGYFDRVLARPALARALEKERCASSRP